MLYERILKNLEERKKRIEEGNINCIPIGMPRFQEEFPGIEKGKYYLISANSKVKI